MNKIIIDNDTFQSILNALKITVDSMYLYFTAQGLRILSLNSSNSKLLNILITEPHYKFQKICILPLSKKYFYPLAKDINSGESIVICYYIGIKQLDVYVNYWDKNKSLANIRSIKNETILKKDNIPNGEDI